MKKEKSQLILQKYKKPRENTMNNCMPTIQPRQNIEEMDNFLETYSLPKLNQEEIDQLNRSNTRNDIEYVIKTLPTNKSPGQMASKVNSTKHTKRN